jgi:hypothetical protein
MIIFHGTADPTPILSGDMAEGTWLAGHRFHAFRLAERRVKDRGGEPIVLEIEIATGSFDRIEGRNSPTYRFCGGDYRVLALHKMSRVEI